MAHTGMDSESRERLDDLVFPPADLDALLDLARLVERSSELALLLGPDGEQVPIPEEVFHVLQRVVEGMRAGKAIMVAPKGLLLTTQEAADYLGISRPTLVKMLEAGEIPFVKPNRHRRVALQDLIAFQERRRTERRDALIRMTRQAEELGLYNDPPDDYAAAIKSARHRRSTPAG